MKESYIVAINRPGMGDIPELVRCHAPEVAAEMVRVLLACHDTNIASVRVEISRTYAKEQAV